jgi:hypothetical protein
MMRMMASGGAIAAMGYLPVVPAARDTTVDGSILAPSNRGCQTDWADLNGAQRLNVLNDLNLETL